MDGEESAALRVLLVCLGNICRSPTAQAVLEKRLREAGLGDRVAVDSAGTGDYHIGKAPDPRAQEAGWRRGYDLSRLRARQLVPADFRHFDYLLAMDEANHGHMMDMADADGRERVHLMLSPLGQGLEVPDPYFGGDDGFDEVLDLIEQASEHWIERFRGELAARG